MMVFLKINKSGRLDMLTSLIIFLIGVAFAIIFVWLSSFVGVFNPDREIISLSGAGIDEDSLLFQKINFQNEDIFVIEAIKRSYDSGDESLSELSKILREKLNEENDCLILNHGSDPELRADFNDIILELGDDGIISSPSGKFSLEEVEYSAPREASRTLGPFVEKYREEGLLLKSAFISNMGKKIYAEHYYGSCLSGGINE